MKIEITIGPKQEINPVVTGIGIPQKNGQLHILRLLPKQLEEIEKELSL